MSPYYQVPSGVYVLPTTLGATVRATAEALQTANEQARPEDALYVEKRDGCQCATCLYSKPVNATHGQCAIVQGTIHLSEGWCCMWTANPKVLHLYREPT